MKNIWILFLILVFPVGPGLAQSELGPLIGRITKDEATQRGSRSFGTRSFSRGNENVDRYSFSMLDFGIEQFEGEKRTTHRFQLWDISCHYPPYSWDGLPPNETVCSVKRTILDRYGEEMGFLYSGTIIGYRSHYAEDGTLKLLYADWKGGKLDFQLILDDKNTIEVKLRLQYRNDSIYLMDFQAMGITRGGNVL